MVVSRWLSSLKVVNPTPLGQHCAIPINIASINNHQEQEQLVCHQAIYQLFQAFDLFDHLKNILRLTLQLNDRLKKQGNKQQELVNLTFPLSSHSAKK